jgi:hypothetical protein
MKTLLQGKPWIPPEKTDVRQTWRQFGWKPTKREPNRPQDMDDYTMTERFDWLSRIGGFK